MICSRVFSSCAESTQVTTCGLQRSRRVAFGCNSPIKLNHPTYKARVRNIPGARAGPVRRRLFCDVNDLSYTSRVQLVLPQVICSAGFVSVPRMVQIRQCRSRLPPIPATNFGS